MNRNLRKALKAFGVIKVGQFFSVFLANIKIAHINQQ